MNAVNFVIVYYYSRKFGVNNYDIFRIVKIWISSLIMFGIIFTIQGLFPYTMINIFIYILGGFFIYLAEIKIFHLISQEEMGYIDCPVKKSIESGKKYVKILMNM